MFYSSCICQKKSFFKEIIKFDKEKVFKDYEGITIGQCQNCNVLKTFYQKKILKDKHASRPNIILEKKEIFYPIYCEIIKRIKKYQSKGSVLDVGCSAGVLLTFLRKEGFSISGIEPNYKAYLMAKKIHNQKIHHGTLSTFYRKNKKKYDVIIYNHVLEHISDIEKEFNLIKKAIKKQGIFVLGTPNYDNFIFHLRKKFWESLMPKEHIWHFSKRNLIFLLKKNDFSILEISFSDDKRNDYPFFKKIYFRLLSFINQLFGTGEAILIIAKKN